METFDVVVVGARCAGSPLAVMLARRGFSVCVVDKARFPSETPSTHVIQPCGVAVLERIGALDAVFAAGAVPIDRFTLVNEDVRIDGTLDPLVFPHAGLCVRRVTLDAALIEAATDSGAEMRTGVKVTELLTDGHRVVGIQTDRGPIHAQLVVGADGRQSRIATASGAQEYLTTPGGRTAAWAYFDGVAERVGHLRLGRLGECGYLASPTDSGLYMAGITTGAGFGPDRDGAFDAGIAGWPELADLLAGARRVGPIRSMARWHGYFRQAAGPGWALIGDAGHFKDFTPAQGISDALRQSAHFAEALPDDLADHEAVDSATRRWWRWRDQDARPMYWFAADMGVPGPSTPLVTAVLRHIAADAGAIQTLLKVLNHEVGPRSLLTPRCLAGATIRALRDHPVAAGKEIAGTIRDEVRRARWNRQPPPGLVYAGDPTQRTARVTGPDAS